MIATLILTRVFVRGFLPVPVVIVRADASSTSPLVSSISFMQTGPKPRPSWTVNMSMTTRPR